MKVKARSRQKRATSDPQDLRRKNGQVTWYMRFLTAFSLSLCFFTLLYIWKLYFHLQYDHFRLSLKRGFSRCGHGFSRCDGLGGLGGLDRLGGFRGFTQFSGLVGFDRLADSTDLVDSADSTDTLCYLSKVFQFHLLCY